MSNKMNETVLASPPYKALPSPPSPALPVSTSTTRVVVKTVFGRDSVQVTCGNCRQVVNTTVVAEIGICNWIAATVVLLLCCPLFWMPLALGCCKDYRHVCPSCNALLGMYKKV